MNYAINCQIIIKMNNNLNTAAVSPKDAAWSKQLPSPVVARGHSRWQVPFSAHQFRRPININKITLNKHLEINTNKRKNLQQYIAYNFLNVLSI